jgi:predicted RND superfamily exporter protein
MSILVIILIVAAMIATVTFLVRGIVSFLANSTAEVHGEQGTKGPSAAALKSNKMMQGRILFQAITIVLVVILFFLAGKH